jgi:hypothetical protein
MTNSPHLSFALVAQNQAQKEVTVNSALLAIDAILNTGAISKAVATPPGSPAAGDVYIVGSSPTGAWSGKAGQIAYFQDIWLFVVPREGMNLWVSNEDICYHYTGSAWTAALNITGGTMQSIDLLGVNATADSTNKLTVKSNAVLFATDSGNVQLKVNKPTAADTASYLFQTGYSGRAEFGLVGDDDFQLKVSPDGSSFYQSMVVDKSSGNVDFKHNVHITGTLSGVSLDGLDDVAVSSPVTGHVIKYNGSSWVNDTVTGASAPSLDGVTDVTITSAATNDFLVKSSGDWVNQSPSTARTSLGLGTAATQASSAFLQPSNNLSDVGSASTARSNLGLGTAATQASGAFLQPSNNLSDVGSASTARSNLGLVIGTNVEAYDANISKFNTAETRSASVNMADNVLQCPELKDYAETRNAVTAASTTTIDIENGNVVDLTHGTDITTFTWSNPSATGKACSFTLIRTKDNSATTRAITWPAAVKWAAATAPTLTQTANAVDIFTFITLNAGTSWYGFLAGADLR